MRVSDAFTDPDPKKIWGKLQNRYASKSDVVNMTVNETITDKQ